MVPLMDIKHYQRSVKVSFLFLDITSVQKFWTSDFGFNFRFPVKILTTTSNRERLENIQHRNSKRYCSLYSRGSESNFELKFSLWTPHFLLIINKHSKWQMELKKKINATFAAHSYGGVAQTGNISNQLKVSKLLVKLRHALYCITTNWILCFQWRQVIWKIGK